ncbi:MAG: DNA polymerase III subunit delta [Odoribacteraceae bacterium]|jgi:DNA polymerase-3 subunit delta'|nr:DNA polymerase III subunit delta [Odoribacteraceae bacterium]
MFFREVIGHGEIKQRLLASLQAGRVGHALLFSGESGFGLLPLSLALTQYLLCTGEKGTDACGRCPACRKMQKLVHPDVHFVFPVTKGSKAKTPVSDDYINEWRGFLLDTPYANLEDWIATMGADDNTQVKIYAEESLYMLRKLTLKSYESDYKVMIIWLPEKMGEESANKLLKILEEPYPNTLFILLAEQPEAVITTILSRTQRLHVPPLHQQEIARELELRFHLPTDQADEIAHTARGDWGRALKMTRQNETEQEHDNQEMFVKLMRLCWERKMLPVNQFVQDLTARGRESQKSFLAHCIRMVRENFIRNFGLKEMVYMTAKEQEFSRKFSPYVHEENVIPLCHEFERAHVDVSHNGNGKIIFTDLCIKVMQNIRPTESSRRAT